MSDDLDFIDLLEDTELITFKQVKEIREKHRRENKISAEEKKQLDKYISIKEDVHEKASGSWATEQLAEAKKLKREIMHEHKQ